MSKKNVWVIGETRLTGDLVEAMAAEFEDLGLIISGVSSGLVDDIAGAQPPAELVIIDAGPVSTDGVRLAKDIGKAIPGLPVILIAPTCPPADTRVTAFIKRPANAAEPFMATVRALLQG